MNEQYKTTEEIDKILEEKRVLLSQKKAEFDSLKDKKGRAQQEIYEDTDSEIERLEKDFRKYAQEWQEQRRALVSLYEKLLEEEISENTKANP